MQRRPELSGAFAVVMSGVALLGLLVLFLPLVILFPLALEPSPILRYPPSGISLAWYGEFATDPDWMAAFGLSVRVALLTSLLATILGTLAAISLANVTRFVRELSYVALLSPIVLPTITVAVGIYGLYARLGLVGSVSGLVLAHTLVTIPFVVATVTASLRKVGPHVEEAAQSLGAASWRVLLQVTLPLLSRGILAGALFAFLISFDEVVIAMFIGGTELVTLPTRILDGVFHEMTPILAAISTLLVLGNVLVAGLAYALMRVSPQR